jgi:hypothetical protein
MSTSRSYRLKAIATSGFCRRSDVLRAENPAFTREHGQPGQHPPMSLEATPSFVAISVRVSIHNGAPRGEVAKSRLV